MADSDIAGTILRRLRRLTWLTVVLYLVVIVIGAWAWWSSYQTKKTMCVFRNDLVQRVSASKQYLAEHGDDLPLGLTKATVESNIINQQRTIDSLSGLGCSNSEVSP